MPCETAKIAEQSGAFLAHGTGHDFNKLPYSLRSQGDNNQKVRYHRRGKVGTFKLCLGV